MFTYRLEAQNGLPLYEALYRHIRQDILSGALTAGERLPSKRSLAEHLQISVMTVETAYHQLEAEGYLYALPKRGFFVSAVDHLPTPAAPTAIPPEPEAPKWHLDLGRNQVDSSRFPAAAWARLTRQVLSEGNFLAPVPQQGLYALRQAIARDLWDFKGMAVAPEQIVVGAGAEYLYLLLAQLLGANGRTVFAVEEPGYPKIRQVYGKCGIVCRPVPLDCQGMDPEALAASGAMAAHISPAHHYPTGLVTPIGRRHALLRWAEASDGFIIEDDYDSEFRFTGRPIPALRSIDRTGRVLYVNTFSRTLAPSLRISYLVLPDGLLEAYQKKLGFYSSTVPALEQYTLAAFLEEGHFETHVNRMRVVYRARRDQVIRAVQASALAGRCQVLGAEAGLHFLLRLDTERGDGELAALAREQGIRLSFLSDYQRQSGEGRSHTLVVSYPGVDPERLGSALDLLAELL